MEVAFTVSGDQIFMKGVLTGRLRESGKLLVHPVNVAWMVADGRIVRFWVDASTDQRSTWRGSSSTFRLSLLEQPESLESFRGSWCVRAPPNPHPRLA